MKKSPLFAIAIIILLLNACSSDDVVDPESQLPPITTTGENTFGAIVDGKLFRPRDGTGTWSSDDKGLKVRGTEETNTEFDARDYKSDKTASILIHVKNLINEGEGSFVFGPSNGLRGLDGNDNTYVHCRIWNYDLGNYQTYVSYQNSGEILITRMDILPNVRSIWSGEFQSKLINIANQNDTIQISLGRFDLETPKLNHVIFK